MHNIVLELHYQKKKKIESMSYSFETWGKRKKWGETFDDHFTFLKPAEQRQFERERNTLIAHSICLTFSLLHIISVLSHPGQSLTKQDYVSSVRFTSTGLSQLSKNFRFHSYKCAVKQPFSFLFVLPQNCMLLHCENEINCVLIVGDSVVICFFLKANFNYRSLLDSSKQ
jgi:hypothetical protein